MDYRTVKEDIMKIEDRIRNSYTLMAYGDALGFVYENTGKMDFGDFSGDWDEENKIHFPSGQWSDLTQLMLITTKSLLDDEGGLRIAIDYNRFSEELNYYQYYRNGYPRHIIKAIESRELCKEEAYQKDVRGYGISRVGAIILANKNFTQGLEETYKNICYFNKHPQVILTGLIIARIFYLLLEYGDFSREELLQRIKEFLIELNVKGLLENNKELKYLLAFEQERVNYLIDLDRLIKEDKITFVNNSWSCKNMLFGGLINYWRILKLEGLYTEGIPSDDIKESLMLAYGLAGLNKDLNIKTLSNVTNLSFIDSMGEYTAKLRNYKVSKKPYVASGNDDNIFNLEVGKPFKHDIFNVSRILEKTIRKGYLYLRLENKTGSYLLIKKDSSDC
ncbi:ADP-ribosylglycohydrolase family protein [Alkaliphilus serpentinus]|uniref:ADP-ribosylglycohydrolase n=1 Tax=Alkaliphilus serpentinus TaxID=1482731 RepID=A0A833HNA9_9FIRM|nr:ADP-ribosylglycohydrolase family protein [Alkaliphilus serpentinus]KAB3529216.1 hypothetical protein F8153_09840 [Alkaliphilus serpentinus]